MQWYHYTILAIVIILVIYFLISYEIYKKIFVSFNKKRKPLVDQSLDFYTCSYDWYLNIPKEDVYIHSYDNLKLHGIYIPPLDKNTDNLAIVIHGYQSCAEDMVIIAKLYSDLGFKILLIDLRGHGQSEGKFTSMGYYEKYDLKKWINFALRNYGSTSKILLHGVSMGAAMSMLVTDIITRENIEYLILDSGFTNFKESLICSLKKKYLKMFLPAVSIFTFIFHKFTLKKISPIKAIVKNTKPFLIIQGEKDKPVPVSMAKELFDASPITEKDILLVEYAPHAKAFEIDKDLVTNTIIKKITKTFNIKKTNIKFCEKEQIKK